MCNRKLAPNNHWANLCGNCIYRARVRWCTSRVRQGDATIFFLQDFGIDLLYACADRHFSEIIFSYFEILTLPLSSGLSGRVSWNISSRKPGSAAPCSDKSLFTRATEQAKVMLIYIYISRFMKRKSNTKKRTQRFFGTLTYKPRVSLKWL